MASPGEGITYVAQDYQNNIANYALVANNYRTELQALLAAMHSGKMTADHALWMFQLTCMPEATQGCEYQMASESDASLAATSIRGQITKAADAMNQGQSLIQASGNHTASAVAAAKNFYSQLGEITKFINQFKLTAILGQSNLKDIQSYIKDITNAINPNPNVPPSIGHTGSRIYSHMNWLMKQAPSQGAGLPTQLNTVQSNINNMNQSVSGVSSYIQTQMNYLNQNLQQYLSVYSQFFSSYNTLNGYITSKSGAN